MRRCPEKFIGYNRICNENCNLNPNGEYYYPFEEGPGSYIIYKCVSSCDEAIVISESIIPHDIIETLPYYSINFKRVFNTVPEWFSAFKLFSILFRR